MTRCSKCAQPKKYSKDRYCENCRLAYNIAYRKKAAQSCGNRLEVQRTG